MCSLDHIYQSSHIPVYLAGKEPRQSIQLTFPRLRVAAGINCLPQGRPFSAERASRHSLRQAQPSGKDDMPQWQQVPWYPHLLGMIRQEAPSIQDELKETFLLCVTSTAIIGPICRNVQLEIKPLEFGWVRVHFFIHAVHIKQMDFRSALRKVTELSRHILLVCFLVRYLSWDIIQLLSWPKSTGYLPVF